MKFCYTKSFSSEFDHSSMLSIASRFQYLLSCNSFRKLSMSYLSRLIAI